MGHDGQMSEGFKRSSLASCLLLCMLTFLRDLPLSNSFLLSFPFPSSQGIVSSRNRHDHQLAAKKTAKRRRGTEAPTPPTPNVEYSNFWGSKSNKDPADEGKVPFQRTLDPIDGPLPPGTYRNLSKDTNPTRKNACALSIKVDVDNPKIEPAEVVRNMQRTIDSGFSTFVFASRDSSKQSWSEEAILGRLRKDTPSHVINECNFVVPFTVPGVNSPFSKSDTRASVLEILRRSGLAEIDTLQLNHREGSPYHLDLLDCLTDLQHDGLLRSITTRDVPMDILKSAKRDGFVVDNIHLNGNLLNHALADQGVCKWSTSPLLGGFLTNKHLNAERIPAFHTLTPSGRRHWRATVANWGKRRYGGSYLSSNELWRKYYNDVLGPLNRMAVKYEVPVASIAQRWALQTHPKYTESVTTTCTFMEDPKTGKQFDRHILMRKVFQFELEDEDMEWLEELSGEVNERNDYYLERDDDPLVGSEKFLLEVEEVDEEYLLYMKGKTERNPNRDLLAASSRKLWF